MTSHKDVDGWDLEGFKKNPVLMVGHKNEQPIGRVVKVQNLKGGLRITLVADKYRARRKNE